MSAPLVIAGAVIFLLLGIGHGALTLRDVVAPRFFTPTDDRVRAAMNGVPLRLNPRTDLWQAWLGFNLSHSLGLVVFGGAVLALAVAGERFLFASTGLQACIALVSAGYVVLSMRFWFWGPALGSGLATGLLLAGFLLQRAGAA